MKRCLVASLIMLMLVGCASAVTNEPVSFSPKPQGTQQAQVFSLFDKTPDPTEGIKKLATGAPRPTQSPKPTEPTDILTVTATPRQTFVPLIPTTPQPNKDGSKPTATPPWATPYPSPKGEARVEDLAKIELATVINCKEAILVRDAPQNDGVEIGKATLGSSYRVYSYDALWAEILYNGQKAYVKTSYLDIEFVNTRPKLPLSYSLCSINVHNLGGGKKIGEVANALMALDCDIICCQEMDELTERSGFISGTRELAAALGYGYWAFCPATSYEGGQFGTAIISRYPIIDSLNVPLDVAKGKERRSLGYARVLLPDGAVDIFNTHLCASDMCFKSINLASLQYELETFKLKTYAVCGDFNCSPPRLYEYLPRLSVVNMDKNTFGDGSVPKILDNVLYTKGIMPTDFKIVDMRSSGATDHDAVYCVINILED